jgi:hypothetical protein
LHKKLERYIIRNQVINDFILYKALIYGEIIDYINNEALAICIDIKLKNKMHSEKK